jgi:RHS repeat-associated protein
MPHLSRMHWDELGQLEYVRRGNDHVWLQYAGGARVRKLVLRGQGVVEDRRYLGAEELYTKRRGKAGGGAVVEQTLTEHAGGGLQVDVRLVVDGKTIAKPVALRRFAVADHLGSCRVEVDPDGGVIAYEEFHPYGTTSYRAMRSGLDAAAGRYRFTGMERDEETGLAQHGARCYAGWLGRWVSADPIGVGDGVNRFAYCRGSPVGCVDTDGCRTSAPDEDAMAAPRSRTRSRMYDLVRPPPEPEEWELEFYDPDPMGTGFMNGMRGTHASEMSPAGRLADIAVGAASDSWDVFGTLAAVSGRMLVGPKGRNVHIGLDVVGLVPGPVGVAADLLNALLYEIQDDPANAALSAVSAIGGIVDAVKAAKYAGDLVEGAVLMLTGGGTKVTTRAARQREVLEEFESHQRGVHGSAGEGPLAAAITSKRSKYSDYAEHHLYPQEAKHRKWFADRGVDVDDYVVRLPKAEHEALHGGGNWRLARRVWEGEWNREIMQRMHREEARLGHRMVAEEMLPVLKKMMSDYLVDGRPITRYRRARKKR